LVALSDRVDLEDIVAVAALPKIFIFIALLVKSTLYSILSYPSGIFAPTSIVSLKLKLPFVHHAVRPTFAVSFVDGVKYKSMYSISPDLRTYPTFFMH